MNCLNTGWISSEGPYVKQFENNFSKFIGVKHCISTNNGTDALMLALKSLNIKKGDEVIVPNYTFPATALPILVLGAILTGMFRFLNKNPILKVEKKAIEAAK